MEIAVGAFCLAKRYLNVQAEIHELKENSSIFTRAYSGSLRARSFAASCATQDDKRSGAWPRAREIPGIRTGFCLCRIRNDPDKHRTLEWTVEFTEKNSLPSAQRQLAIFDQDRLADPREDGFHVRVGV